MKKRTVENILTGILFSVVVVGMVSFAAWRCEVNSPSQSVRAYLAEREREEESVLESIRAEQTEATTSILRRLEEYAERVTVTEIKLTEVIETEMSLPEPTTVETEPATTQTEPETSAETVPDAQRATETNESVSAEEIPVEPAIVHSGASTTMTAEEEQLIMRVASCEAGNQGWFGMALVMRVVLNRSQAWGMSISDVIYAPRQFSVIGCGKWNEGFIATEAPIALQAIKDGWDGSQGALFFCAPSGRSQWMVTTKQYLFTAGGHEFYK